MQIPARPPPQHLQPRQNVGFDQPVIVVAHLIEDGVQLLIVPLQVQQLPPPRGDAPGRVVLGLALQYGALAAVDLGLQLFQIRHVALEQPRKKPVQQLLVIQRSACGQRVHRTLHILLCRLVPAEEKQVLPVDVYQHLAVFPRLPHIVPVKGQQVEVGKGLKALRLQFTHILKYGGVHLLRHLIHILPQQHAPHIATVLSPAVYPTASPSSS